MDKQPSTCYCHHSASKLSLQTKLSECPLWVDCGHFIVSSNMGFFLTYDEFA